jgi:hypothetical protein
MTTRRRRSRWNDPKVWVPLLTVVIASVVGPIIVIYYQSVFPPPPQQPSGPNTPGTGSQDATSQPTSNGPVKKLDSTTSSNNQDTKGQSTTTQDNTNSSGQLSISTEKSSYVIDETVAIIGKVGNVVPGQDVRIDIYNSLGDVFRSDVTAEPDIQGRYSADVHLEAYFVNDVVGEYKAVATYNGQSVETKFTVESHA